jgi:hypothetical protein
MTETIKFINPTCSDSELHLPNECAPHPKQTPATWAVHDGNIHIKISAQEFRLPGSVIDDMYKELHDNV